MKALSKRFFPKAFVIEGHNGQHPVYLSCYVVPAVFHFKKNPNYQYHSEFYSVLKNGYIVFEFLEGNDLRPAGEGRFAASAKRTFVMTMANVREFLDIDPDFSLKISKRGG